ncbi:MAG: hypothetical protein ABIJ85_02675 [bacterium]
MIQKIKQKLISVYLSKRKLFNVIGILLFAGLLIIFGSRHNQKKAEPLQASPLPRLTPSAKPFTANPNEDYFINQIITNLTPVTGYSWKGNKLVYSTPNGIYEAGTNNPVLEQNIESIVWANSFNAILKSGGSWKKFDYLNKKTEELPYPLNDPVINSKGEKILDRQRNIVKLFDLIKNTNKEASFEELVDRIFFIEDISGFIVSTTSNNKTHVYKYNEGFTREQSVVLEGNFELSSISPNGDSFLLTFGNELKVANFSGSISNNVFAKGSGLSTGYVDGNKIVIIERYKDSLNRSLENIYLSNLQGNKFKISDSKPMKNRINMDIPIAFSKGGGVVSFAENNGKIWILALTPNMFPTYSTRGDLVFSKIDSKGF